MDLAALPFGELLDRVSSRTPVPGGGAVAASVGALAAALARMALAFSEGRKEFAHAAALHADAAGRLERARWLLLELAAEDAQAYEALHAAMKRPKDDPARAESLAHSARAAVQPPLAVIAACADLLRLFESLAPVTGRFLRSDLAIAAVLAEATARASRWNVEANAPLLGADAGEALATADRALAPAAARLRTIESLCRAG
jgi:formiminotetrahydrofolate cyclodeaminase